MCPGCCPEPLRSEFSVFLQPLSFMSLMHAITKTWLWLHHAALVSTTSLTSLGFPHLAQSHCRHHLCHDDTCCTPHRTLMQCALTESPPAAWLAHMLDFTYS